MTITATSKRKTIKSNYSLWTNRQMRHLYTSNFNHLCGHILTLILSHKSFKRWSSHLCVRYLTLWIKSVNYLRKKDRIFLSVSATCIYIVSVYKRALQEVTSNFACKRKVRHIWLKQNGDRGKRVTVASSR